jgi:hypothetical protein
MGASHAFLMGSSGKKESPWVRRMPGTPRASLFSLFCDLVLIQSSALASFSNPKIIDFTAAPHDAYGMSLPNCLLPDHELTLDNSSRNIVS